MPEEAKCIRLNSISGFRANFTLDINDQDILLELDLDIDPGSSFEYIDWPEPHDILDWSKEIYFNGVINIIFCRITLEGGEIVEISGTLDGDNARILKGVMAPGSDINYLLLESDDISEASFNLNAFNFDIDGTILMDGRVEIKYDESYGSPTAKYLSLITLNNDPDTGFYGIMSLTLGTVEIGMSVTLESGGFASTVIDIPIGQNVLKSFGLNTDPNTVIENMGVTLKFGLAGIRITTSGSLWGDNFLLWWNFMQFPPAWGWGGSIGGGNPYIEATEDGGGTWDQIWPDPFG